MYSGRYTRVHRVQSDQLYILLIKQLSPLTVRVLLAMGIGDTYIIILTLIAMHEVYIAVDGEEEGAQKWKSACGTYEAYDDNNITTVIIICASRCIYYNVHIIILYYIYSNVVVCSISAHGWIKYYYQFL